MPIKCGFLGRNQAAETAGNAEDDSDEIRRLLQTVGVAHKPLDSLKEPGSLELVQQSNVPCRKSSMRQKAAQNILLQFTFGKFPLLNETLAVQKPFHIQWPTHPTAA